MKALRGSLLAKICAIFLLIFSGIGFAASLAGGLVLYEMGAYRGEYLPEEVLSDVGFKNLNHAAGYLVDVLDGEEAPTEEAFDAVQANLEPDFRYVLYTEDGTRLYDGLRGENWDWSGTFTLVKLFNDGDYGSASYPYHWSWWHAWDGPTFQGRTASVHPAVSTPSPTLDPDSMPSFEAPDENGPAFMGGVSRSETLDEPGTEGEEKFFIQGYILSEKSEGSPAWRMTRLYTWAYSWRYHFVGLAVAAALLAIVLFIFLMCAAGHRDGSETVTPNFIDKLPFDLFAAAVFAGFMFLVWLGLEALREVNIDYASGVLFILVALAIFIAAAVLAILFCMSFATRLKLGTVIKSCICFKILVWCWRAVKAILRWFWRLNRAIFRALWKFIRSISLMKKTVLITLAVLAVEFVWMCMFEWNLGAQIFGWFMERTALVLLVLYAILCLRRLQKGAREMAKGNEDYVIDTQYMHGDFKDAAEDLNSIRDGMVRAVDERMKSERFKTELITNVSHDIKTPLTSIINYVDLLNKEEPENEKMRAYIEVLSRQSARLKKLIEDLIEASKASTGNLSVNLERCELGVLLDQTVGEYGEKLSAAQLELVVKKPVEPITVMADGRHTWRIFDNLMNNVCKYAQPGTRVYLDLEKRGNKALVTFRNISKSQLNISGEELMERFVRGDSSRNTEGSGLGLSIARSLAQLQGTELDLTVDGDLFKVTLSFDTVR